MNINDYLNNPENCYYGHGTGTENQKIINSIIKNGLRCSHGSLYFTSVSFGFGKEITDETKKKMKNWPHKESKIIIVVSLPYKYNIIESADIGTYHKENAAFYYIPDEETRQSEKLTNSFYIMPEFIVGYYDARTDSFIKNDNYYEQLSHDKQEELFKKVKQNYFDIIDEGCGIDYYQECLKSINRDIPLTEDEVKYFKKNKLENKLFSQIGSSAKNIKIKLLNGNEIPLKKYLEEVVFPFIPLDGYIVLKNGNKLPVIHFILECVLYDCQERYYGDFALYLKENVDLDKTKKINSFKETIEDEDNYSASTK